jgi:hypothetical protein
VTVGDCPGCRSCRGVITRTTGSRTKWDMQTTGLSAAHPTTGGLRIDCRKTAQVATWLGCLDFFPIRISLPISIGPRGRSYVSPGQRPGMWWIESDSPNEAALNGANRAAPLGLQNLRDSNPGLRKLRPGLTSGRPLGPEIRASDPIKIHLFL